MTTIYDIALILTHDQFHIFLFIFGVFAIDRNKFLQVVAICMFASFINLKLKEYFAIPMHSSLGRDWYAYPSGHTNWNIVLWGAVFILFRRWQILLFPITVFPFFFLGMRHYNYHTTIDIAAGAAEAVIILIVFYYSLKFFKKDYSKFIALITVISAILLSFVDPKFQRSWTYMHLGSMIAIYVLYKIRIQNIKSTLMEKTMNTAIACLVFLGAFNLKDLDLYDHWLLVTATSTIVTYFMIAATPIVTHRLLSSVKQIHRAP